MIAYADFAQAEHAPKEGRLARVLELARTLPTTNIDPALGIQSESLSSCTVTDQLNANPSL